MALLKVKPLVVATAAMMVLGLTACGGEKAPVKAQGNVTTATEGTLDKIKKSGTIVLGYRDSSIPFSYVTDNPNQPVGYSHDLQLKVVEAVKQKLGMPDLKVRYHLVGSQTRIPSVQNGTVDIECASTTNTPERQQQVAFSVGFFQASTRILTAKDSGIKDFSDLPGKTLVTTVGSTSERYIRQYISEKKLNVNLISAKDHGESFLMLENGRAAALVLDDVLLAGERAKAKDPSKWEIVGTPQTFEIYGCMVRKDDPAFKEVVDGALKEVYKSGEINKIYEKWFTSPIPPKNVNMNFVMSDNLKELLANPHDSDKPKKVGEASADAVKAEGKSADEKVGK